MKIISTAWLRELPERMAPPGLRTALAGPSPDRWRHLLADERLPGRVRVACLLLLIILLSQASARLTWDLLTPSLAVPPESVGAPLRPGAAGGGKPQGSVAEAAAMGEQLAALHLFGQAQPQQPQASATAMIEAPETTLSLLLKGLVATSNGERGLAVIAEKGRRGGDGVYGIGDQVPGNATIEAIFVDRVILRRAGKLETLYLESREEGATPRAASAPAAGRSAPAGDQRQLSRRYVEQTLANLPDLARQVEVHIHNPEGGRHGFRLVAQQGSEFLNNLGLQPGDILYEINGIPLTDAGAAMVAFEQLRSARDIRLVFERAGAPQQINIAIR
ncbi:MAG: type II secretion system protein GspC [Desulfurivibrio sp.]